MVSVGGSDIVAAIRLGFHVYELGYAQENRADVRYSNFLNEILNFSHLLERLNESLTNAQNRFIQQRPEFDGRYHDDLWDKFEQERKTIVGNFRRTLEDCEALLQKNQHFRDRDSNVLENLRYNLSQQEVQVDFLRRRLFFHSQKIRMVLDRLTIDILVNLDGKLDDIQAISEQNLQVARDIQERLARFQATWLDHIAGREVPDTSAASDAFAISSAIAQKFSETLVLPDRDAGDGVPLSKGFDALLLHFDESSEDGSDRTPRGYLLFLKSRWLLERIQEGDEYRRARPGFYFKRAISQVDRAISTRMAQPETIIAYDDDILLELPDACFQIWPSDQTSQIVEYRKPDPVMVRGGEERLARIQLASSTAEDTETVTIMKSSDEHFRIVHESTPNAASGRTIVTSHNIFVKEDRLVPRYTFPTLQAPCLELMIFCRNVEEYFRFKSLQDLHEFQSALMGYQVSHQQEHIRCQFSTKDLDCMGNVQLWQEPISVTAPIDEDAATPRSPSCRSPAATSQNGSLSSSFAVASTIYATGEGWEAEPIKRSSLVIFTRLADTTHKAKKKPKKFAVLSVDLDTNMIIDPRSCACRHDPECKMVVLNSRRDVPFTVRYLLSELDSSGQPDPRTFDILQLRTPRLPAREQGSLPSRTPRSSVPEPRLLVKKTEYLALVFDTTAAKNLFIEELNLRFLVRDQQIENQRTFERNLRYHQERPKQRQHSTTSGSLKPRQSSFNSHLTATTSGERRHSRNRGSISAFSTSPGSDHMRGPVNSHAMSRPDSDATGHELASSINQPRDSGAIPNRAILPVLPAIARTDFADVFALGKEVDGSKSLRSSRTDSGITVSTLATLRDDDGPGSSPKSRGLRKLFTHVKA